MSEEAKPARKIKPPSASFLKSKEMPAVSAVPSEERPAASEIGSVESAEPSEESSAAAAHSEEPLGAPSVEGADDQDLFSVPDDPAPSSPEPSEVAEAVLAAPSSPAPATDAVPPREPEEDRPAPTMAERLAAELRELQDIVKATDSLAYLRSRVNRAMDEGVDAITLVSFYRLVVRSLLEQGEQARRDYESMRSKANKLELELAAASLAQVSEGGSGGPPRGEGPASAEAQERIAKLEIEVAQANEQREKLLVDFKNMRERTQKDLDIKVFREKEKFFREFLPVLDSFERAGQSMNENSTVSSVIEGFRLIGNQLHEALKNAGLETIDDSGLFDPRFHEAVGEVQNEEKPDEYVYDTLSTGYRLGERLIRPAMVRISRNPNMKEPPAPPPTEAEEEPEP